MTRSGWEIQQGEDFVLFMSLVRIHLKKKNQVVRNPKNSTEILGSIFVSILDIP